MSKVHINHKHTAIFTAVLIFLQCSNLSLKSLDSSAELDFKSGSPEIKKSNTHIPLSSVFFFDEKLSPGGYFYAYPTKSVTSYTDTISQNGLFSVLVDLDANYYSGGAICRGEYADLISYRQNAALKFWIKGQKGGEKAWIGLVDQSRSSREKAVTRLPLSNFISITSAWQQVSIPLIAFSDYGVYWDSQQKVEIPCDIDWSRIAEVRIEVTKNENKSFKVFLDDIYIEPNTIDASAYNPILTWDRYIETVYPPRYTLKSNYNIAERIFNGRIPEGGFTYVYGGNTSCVLQKNAMDAGRKILVCYLDDNQYSAVTIVSSNKKAMNFKDYRKNGGLVFWAKIGLKTTSIQIGLLDHQNENRKVQARVSIEQYGKIYEEWKKFIIPLHHFSDIGVYWDDIINMEIESPIDWNSIHEIRFSCVKSNSALHDSIPVTLYLDEINIVDNVSDTSKIEKYWNSFQSHEKELTLHDFQNNEKSNWFISKGHKSESSFELINAPDNSPLSISRCISVTYSLQDWCDLFFSYTDNNFDSLKLDWTKHWGISFFLYTEKEFQGITVQIADSGNEHYVANIGTLRGRNDIIVPFREFSKFIYFQPDDAIQNNRLDLDGVKGIAFKASGNNTSGRYLIANVKLTNERDSKAVSLFNIKYPQ